MSWIVESLVESTVVTGFPVVSNLEDCHILGFIGRSELQFALSQARSQNRISDNTPCSFLPFDNVQEERVLGFGMDDVASDNDALTVATSSTDIHGGHQNESLNLRKWMDRTPMIISPRVPVAIALEVFRKMGVRYVLAYENAGLEGIVTKKDLLEHLDNVKRVRK